MAGVQKVSNTSAFQQSENRINVCDSVVYGAYTPKMDEWAFKGMARCGFDRICVETFAQ